MSNTPSSVLSRRELTKRVDIAYRDINRLTSILAISVQLIQKLMDLDATNFPTVTSSGLNRHRADRSGGASNVLTAPASFFKGPDLELLYSTFYWNGAVPDGV
jgi:hypothetical protein